MRLLSLLLVPLLFVYSCNSGNEKSVNSDTSISDTSSVSIKNNTSVLIPRDTIDKKTLAIDYAKIAIKEWFNSGPGKIEDYDLGSPIVKIGSSIYCDNNKIDFALVCFNDTIKEGCAYVFLEIKDDFFSSFLGRGETVETPDQLIKAALEADEKTNDFWHCGDAD
jgi:hypothetical protein